MRLITSNRAVFIILVVCLLFLDACQFMPSQSASSENSSASDLSVQTLTNLQDIQQIQTLFNAAEDSPRLILLLSPK